ncbi:MAG: hypothetical protein HY226_04575 [Candidatus Vogelbacteria bacterium]|nr:hypothetical protein [Candidatus Vogelbacteria bacterium]
MEDDTSMINWALIYSIAVFFDLVGALLSFFAIGLIVNRVIDLLLGPAFALWFYVTGIKGWGWRLLVGDISKELPIFGDFTPDWTIAIYFIRKKHLATIAGKSSVEDTGQGFGPTQEAQALNEYSEQVNY